MCETTVKVRHKLTNIDLENKTADCSECGVGVEIKVYKSSKTGGMESRCMAARRASWSASVRLRNGHSVSHIYSRTAAVGKHALSEIDEENRTGRCYSCGVVKIHINPRSPTGWSCSKYGTRAADPWFVLPKLRHLINSGQVKELYYAQGTQCAICKLLLVDDEYKPKYHIDHCHEKDYVRGLLCHHCNTGLGLLKDSQDNLRNATNYLDTPPAPNILAK